MAINALGTKVEVPRYESLTELESFIGMVVKRREERVILKEFLLSLSLSGRERFEEIKETSQLNSSTTFEDGLKNQVIEFCIERLKRSSTPVKVSLYEDMVLQVIENLGRLPSRKYARCLRLKGEARQDIPESFPGDHKRAETLIVGELRSDIGGKEFREYLVHKAIKAKIGIFVKDLFFAINLGLEPKQVLQFMGVLYELRKLQTADPTNERLLKENLVDSLKLGSELTLVHIKCLRFTYPYGNRVKVLEDCEDEAVPTKDGGVHFPLSEKQVVARLLKIRDIIGAYGIKAKLLVLLSDQDLLDYFPSGDGGGIVPDNDIQNARLSLERYQEKISSFLRTGNIKKLREHLRQEGLLGRFDLLRTEVFQKLKSGQGGFDQGFVESRVNYRYESNKKIFVVDPGRQFARDRVYSQLASLQALSVLGQSQNGGRQSLILIEEDRGEENAFIGGYKRSALPVFFTQLRD